MLHQSMIRTSFLKNKVIVKLEELYKVIILLLLIQTIIGTEYYIALNLSLVAVLFFLTIEDLEYKAVDVELIILLLCLKLLDFSNILLNWKMTFLLVLTWIVIQKGIKLFELPFGEADVDIITILCLSSNPSEINSFIITLSVTTLFLISFGLITKKITLRDEIPFIPFISIAFTIKLVVFG